MIYIFYPSDLPEDEESRSKHVAKVSYLINNRGLIDGEED
jgi:hypothetical protein